MTRYEKAMINDMVDEIFKGFAIGLPVMLIVGSVFYEMVVKAV